MIKCCRSIYWNKDEVPSNSSTLKLALENLKENCQKDRVEVSISCIVKMNNSRSSPQKYPKFQKYRIIDLRVKIAQLAN
jgi:hypothetical protein